MKFPSRLLTTIKRLVLKLERNSKLISQIRAKMDVRTIDTCGKEWTRAMLKQAVSKAK